MYNKVVKRVAGMVIFAIIFLAFFNSPDTNWERVNADTFEQSIMDNPGALLLDSFFLEVPLQL